MSTRHRAQADTTINKAVSEGGAAGAAGSAHHSAAGSHAQNKYLCTLYGLIRYDAALAAVPPAGGVAAPSPSVVAVARLCSLLRAMAHSDTQLLMQGRQNLALLNLPAPPPTTPAPAAQPIVVAAVPRPTTPASGAASPFVAPPSPSSQTVPLTPTTGASPFFAAGATAAVVTSSSSRNVAPAAPATTGAATAAALAFATMPLFHESSQSLLDATQLPTPSAHSSSFGHLSLHTLAPSPLHQADLTYLLAREARLAPITAIVAGNSNWAALMPQRFSRYTRVYKPVEAAPAGMLSPASGTDVWVWRDVELQSQAPVPSFLSPAASNGGAAAASAAVPGSTGASSSSSAALGANANAACASRSRWHMSSLGKALLPAKTTCHVRPIRLVPLSSNYESLLHAPGAALSRDYEFVQEGFRFEDRDNIEVLLYQVLRVPAPGALAQSAAIRGNRWLCEVRSICNDDQLHAQQAKVNAYAKALEQ